VIPKTLTYATSLTIFTTYLLSSASGVNLTTYYDFEGAGADQFDDPAGNYSDDLTNFGVSFSFDTPGVGGSQSALFDGSSALFTDAYSTDLGPASTSFTVMFWVKGADLDQKDTNTRLMTTRLTPDLEAAAQPAWQIEGFGNDGTFGDRMDLRMANPGAGNWFNPDANNALANLGETAEWRHVAFVASNTGHPTTGEAYAETFVDGVSAGVLERPSWTNFSVGNTNGQLILGGHSETGGARAFTGGLDDVALFDGVVDSATIQGIADGTVQLSSFVPEPSTALLFASCLPLILTRRRSRR